MSEKQGPSDEEILRFVDADLSPEQMERVDEHLSSCPVCAARVAALRELVEDVRAPISGSELDVSDHVASVMSRLDVAEMPRKSRNTLAWAGGLGVAAALSLLIGYGGGEEPGVFTARGGHDEASFSRDVGVQLYAQDTALRPLRAGERVRPGTALTAGLRNTGREAVHLLLFAIDARQTVHWIAPEFTVTGQDPVAIRVGHSPAEKLLPNAAAFDDLAPGRLRVVVVIGRRPARVSEIESLSAAELAGEELMKRFPEAEIRQFLLEVTP